MNNTIHENRVDLETKSQQIVKQGGFDKNDLTSFFIFRSPAEVKFAEMLRDAGFVFGVNVRMQLLQRDGSFAFREADFIIFGVKKIVVEIDGSAYHKDKVKDAIRNSLFACNGFVVIRIPAEKLYDSSYVENCIKSIKRLSMNQDIHNENSA
jgi:very-short-patch-repair endonuclease